MKVLGISATMRAALDAIDDESRAPFRNVMAYQQAACGAALLVKAAIAKHDPDAVFPDHRADAAGHPRDLDLVVRHVERWTYEELPHRYAAAAGYPMTGAAEFLAFGRRRAVIEHLRVPEGADLSDEVLKFFASFVEPFVLEHWDRSVVEDIDFFYPHAAPELVKRLRRFTRV